jgi:hypothetical protein
MSALTDAANALRDLESQLVASARAEANPLDVAERVRQVLRLLAGQEVQWIGTTEAKRLLGVGSENTVKAWARLGFLRSRTPPNGRLQVRLDDVLRRRVERDELSAIGGEELSSDELRILRETRPGKNPWERTKADQAR